MTPATAAAVSLLERLRTLAETWPGVAQPGVHTLVDAVRSVPDEAIILACNALDEAAYYEAARPAWIPSITAAIAALKGETT